MSAEPVAYIRLVERLNRFPQGAAPTPTLYKILKILFSESEAGLVARLPIKPFTVQQASRSLGLSLVETQKVLERLAGRALLVDVEQNGEMTYVLPPPMAGFFEFALMRQRDDIDQKLLSRLFEQYCSVEDDFFRDLLTGGETKAGRILVNEAVLPVVEVLDYERASEIIRHARRRGVADCYCRVKRNHISQACDAPVQICLTFDGPAEALVRHGFARSIDAGEGLELLAQAQEHNLVQFSENSRRGGSFMCNCCGCCCEALIATRRFGTARSIQTSNFLAQVESSLCNGCGKCVNVCPVEGMGLVSANQALRPNLKKARLIEEMCLGCGVCARVCPRKAISLKSRPQRVITPLNTAHRALMMAVERGKLQELIFDNQALASQHTLAVLLGAVLRLPPVQRVLAGRQIKSRFFEYLIERMGM